MHNEASDRLKRLNEKIMHTWEERVLKEVGASTLQHSFALRDSLSLFLDQVASALSTNIERSKARAQWDKIQNTRIGKKHGRDRAGMYNYTIDQLIFEYHILRQVIFDVMEDEAPLSETEMEVIICAVEQSVNDAATQFSDTISDIQERFTYTLAHDLRGPLTSAKLYSQFFLRKPGDLNKAIDAMKRISASMERLDLMITDLLDAGKMRAGKELKLETEKCDLELILNQVTEEINLLYDDRVTFKTMGPVKGMWNASGIRRVFDNLVTNALKFSESGSQITISLEKTDSEVRVSVQNYGNPIPSNEIEILFEEYKRSPMALKKKGWGLGLVVVKGITEAHNGHIEVESSVDKGTVFKVVLPLFEKSTSTIPHEPKERPRSQPSP